MIWGNKYFYGCIEQVRRFKLEKRYVRFPSGVWLTQSNRQNWNLIAAANLIKFVRRTVNFGRKRRLGALNTEKIKIPLLPLSRNMCCGQDQLSRSEPAAIYVENKIDFDLADFGTAINFCGVKERRRDFSMRILVRRGQADTRKLSGSGHALWFGRTAGFRVVLKF